MLLLVLRLALVWHAAPKRLFEAPTFARRAALRHFSEASHVEKHANLQTFVFLFSAEILVRLPAAQG